MKTIILTLIFVLSQTAVAGIAGDLKISGYVSQIKSDKVVLFSRGRLVDVPKSLIKKKVRIGEEIHLSLSLKQTQSITKTSRIPASKKPR